MRKTSIYDELIDKAKAIKEFKCTYILVHPRNVSAMPFTINKNNIKKYKGLTIHEHFSVPMDSIYFYNHKPDIK